MDESSHYKSHTMIRFGGLQMASENNNYKAKASYPFYQARYFIQTIELMKK